MSAHQGAPRAEDVAVASRRPLELDTGFHEALYQWMDRAPWLGISALFHLLLFFVFAALPWRQMREPELPEVLLGGPLIEETHFVEEVEPPLETEAPPVELEEPVLSDERFSDPSPADSPAKAPTSDPWSSPAVEPFDGFPELGIGGGSKFDGRFGPRGSGPARTSRAVEKRLEEALEWLRHHQAPDGHWDADGFSAQCGALGSDVCAGPGLASHDVGVSALALLAFLGEGSTTNRGRWRDVVQRGIRWLVAQQDPDSGRIGSAASHDSVYDHAIATLALSEAYLFSNQNPIYRRKAQLAVDFCLRSRTPYAGWRYAVPSIGESDTSITGWMVLALASAKEAQLEVDEEALSGALSWLDEVSDGASGRVGYDGLGVLSSRTKANEHFPPEKGEAMTAVGLLCRFFLGQDPAREALIEKHADLLLRALPEWDPDGFGCDMYYWYHGSYAMYQMGGSHWRRWREALEPTLLGSQRRDGDAVGSWDPVGPWGYAGGRVYSTSLMTLCLEVDFRYGRILGGR